MSYDVTIALASVPADNKEAWRQVHEYFDQHEGDIEQQEPMPACFAKLYEELTHRFPCICDLPDERVDDGVWSDGPLRNNFGREYAQLAMVFSRVDEVLPFLIDSATRLGLTVFDPQTDHIHRPGASSPAATAKSWWQFWK
jgi:hypothetical protein